MNEYTPDGWMIFSVKGKKGTHYRLLGTWSGGYLDGDTWRINSGIERYEVVGDYYLFHGGSGSIYRCHKNGYGVCGAYNSGIVDQLAKREDVEFIAEKDWKADVAELVDAPDLGSGA